MKFVDAHHHFWDLKAVHYPWLMAHGVRRFFGDPAPIQKNYLPHDLLNESPRWRPEKSVHIQVGAADGHSLRESEWLQNQATLSGLPNAFVAFVDLAAADSAARIEEQKQLPNFRGVRQIIGRHEVEDRVTRSGELLTNPKFRQGLTLLVESELSFDLQLVPGQYQAAWKLFSTLPELRVAICHCGSPWDQSPAGLMLWKQGLRRFAELPNFYCKVSGLGMFNPQWTLADLRPLVEEVINLFGPERVMLGSNFPVDKLYTRYDNIWSAYEALTQGLKLDEKEQLFAGTAELFYRI